MKILICDDDRTSLFVLGKMLEKLGFEYLTAGDGHEALRQLISERPSVVITDFQMPHMDGLELCQKVRNSGGIDKAYIIMVTAFRDETDVQKALDAGADDFISKPFQVNNLAIRLQVAKNAVERRFSMSQ